MGSSRRWEHTRLCTLYFLHAHALGLWGVNLSNVLKAHGLESIVPYAYACSSIAALISPLAIGALADLRMSPERVLRRLGLGSALFLWIMYYAIGHRWGAGWVLLLTQLHALWSVPTFGLTTAFILSRLQNPQKSFGPVRLWATLGWMSAGWMVSWVLLADASVWSGYAGAIAWLFIVGFTYALPTTSVIAGSPQRTLREIFGLDALKLLRQADHRIVFITAALFNAVLAAFYPFAVLHLEDLGVGHVTAVMSLGQVTEIIAMLGLATLLGRFRLKWIFLTGIGFSVLRYAIFTVDQTWALLVGILLHGFCFTFFFTTAQIYLVRRVPLEFRSRAQALLTLMTSGIGNLAGSLGFGWWRGACQSSGRTDWPLFWSGMTLATALVFVFFAVAYRGAPRMEQTDE
ncbi:MAG: MFS transporter [Verrucomicrobia bacterium]|nr:MFS transporter [Verrucomicrobiota bacterium]